MKYITLILLIFILLSGSLFAQKEALNNFNFIGKSKLDLSEDNFPPSNPSKFNVKINCTYVRLTWVPNNNDDPVIVAYNSENKFGNLVNGKKYNEDDIIPGGGTIVYIGSCKHFRHFYPASDNCYYKIWSFSKNFIYSVGLEAGSMNESVMNSVIKIITSNF